MRTTNYTLNELLAISTLTDFTILSNLKTKSINENMQFRKLLQMSLVKHNKELNFDIQMKIVGITMFVERYCRPYIYQEHYINIRTKYPEISEQKAKALANEKLEKTIRKCSY